MEQAIAALLTHPSIEDVARLAGVGEKTLRRWMQQPQFNERYLRARREVVSQTVARVQQATGAAGVTILKLMTDVNVTAAVRLRAAESVLNLAVKGIEIEDIERRLLELESAAETRPLGEWLASSKSGKRALLGWRMHSHLDGLTIRSTRFLRGFRRCPPRTQLRRDRAI
jgi:hypothetical protein